MSQHNNFFKHRQTSKNEEKVPSPTRVADLTKNETKVQQSVNRPLSIQRPDTT